MPLAASFSAIILASRPDALRRCLESVARAAPAENFECLLVLNGDDRACAAAAAAFLGRIPGLALIDDAPRSLGGARNAAIARARGRWLCFLDDDVTVPATYFAALLDKIDSYPEAAALGGPNATPPESSLFQRCVGALLGSWLAAGPMRRRCSGFPRDAWCGESGLILCNLSIDRNALIEEGLGFDESLVRNEENLLLERLSRRGRRALHAPALMVYHERRDSLASFCRQCFLSGRGRAEMTARLPGSLKALHLAPLLVLACAANVRLAAGYAALALLNAVFLAARHRERFAAVGWLILLYPAAHASYAAGLAAGFALSLIGCCAPKENWAGRDSNPQGLAANGF